jgi:hypothetical protein
MSDELREGFEAWATSRGMPTIRYAIGEVLGAGAYQDDCTMDAWAAWKASRQHDGHAEFVRKVREIAEIAPDQSPALLQSYMNNLADLCEAELAKDQS